jgi:WD40 repeat protein
MGSFLASFTGRVPTPPETGTGTRPYFAARASSRSDVPYRTIRSLKVSPDGKFLASCGEDEAIRIWDLCSGSQRAQESGAVGTGLAPVRDPTFPTAPPLVRTLRRDRPYERLNITGIRGLTEAQKASLRALGAIEEAIS